MEGVKLEQLLTVHTPLPMTRSDAMSFDDDPVSRLPAPPLAGSLIANPPQPPSLAWLD